MTTTSITDFDVARAEAALRTSGLPGRGDWSAVMVRDELHDRRAVRIVRFQRERYRPGGPHLSLVLDAGARLLGYTRLVPSPAGGGTELPDAADAHRAAFGFFRGLDAEWAAGLTELWIDRHDETIVRPGGDRDVVAGMKVKTRHSAGLYAWAVVGQGGTIITLEREIRWDPEAGRRGTQMWLHDAWIAAHDGHGTPLRPPYALP